MSACYRDRDFQLSAAPSGTHAQESYKGSFIKKCCVKKFECKIVLQILGNDDGSGGLWCFKDTEHGSGCAYWYVELHSANNSSLIWYMEKDSGKTTLTESILLNSSYLSSSGTVDTGSTTTDFLPAERERGITIQSASIPVKWKDWTFNLIDTPGHADFGMEVESASRVVDGAVVLIDSVEGVESQTKAVWTQLDRWAGVHVRDMPFATNLII